MHINLHTRMHIHVDMMCILCICLHIRRHMHLAKALIVNYTLCRYSKTSPATTEKNTQSLFDLAPFQTPRWRGQPCKCLSSAEMCRSWTLPVVATETLDGLSSQKKVTRFSRTWDTFCDTDSRPAKPHPPENTHTLWQKVIGVCSRWYTKLLILSGFMWFLMDHE